MNRAILVLNAGSSSLKFSIHRIDGPGKLRVVARGQVEGLGTRPRFAAADGDGAKLADESLGSSGATFTHADAFGHLAGWCRGHFGERLAAAGVGHRVVHGGLDCTRPTLITPEVLSQLEALVPLVPLHQPHNVAVIKAVAKLQPQTPQVACFDTGFHQGRAKITERFALPDEMFRRGIRRWGFHGLSYESIAAQFREIDPRAAAGRVIVAHLGSGASMCAMRDGRSVDTTLGFSALDGLPMGTRCGAIDPGAVLYLVREMGREAVERLLHSGAGLLGMSGVSNDMRDLLASREPLAAEAVDYFVYRAVREVGALTAVLGGLDALVFTAGIGERSPEIRRRICAGLGWLGVRIDAARNQASDRCISPPGATPSIWVIPTDEEGVIASHTLALLAPKEPA